MSVNLYFFNCNLKLKNRNFEVNHREFAQLKKKLFGDR